jgi:hypothetical protein
MIVYSHQRWVRGEALVKLSKTRARGAFEAANVLGPTAIRTALSVMPGSTLRQDRPFSASVTCVPPKPSTPPSDRLGNLIGHAFDQLLNAAASLVP